MALRPSTPPPHPPLHRAIWSLQLPPLRLAGGLVLALAATALLLALEPQVHAAWNAALVGGLGALDLGGHFLAAAYGGTPFGLRGPLLEPALPAPEWPLLALHGVAAVAVWIGSARLPDAARPATYLLRFAALIHGCAVLFFAGWAPWFEHSVTGHGGNLLQQIWMLMLAVPWLHLVIYHLLPFAWWQRVALTAVSLAWLAVLAPLLVASHTALLALLGAVVMPLLQMLLGITVAVIGLVALYGWAMSWPAPRPEEPAWH